MNGPISIRMQDLTRVYGTRAAPVRAVKGISLEIGAGVTAVVGPNGAGKTTLLALILGFLRPTTGSVRIDGRTPRRWIRGEGAAYLPERFRLPAGWTVGGALHGLARLEGLAGDEAGRRVDAVVDRLGLAGLADRAIGSLSRGMSQRLGLAQALLADRRLVVLDEPTEGLDPLWRITLREIVDEMRRDGRTVLLASHELPEVERAADRVVVLRDGRVQEIVTLDRGAASALRFRIHADASDDVIADAFPDATRDGEAILVRVADARELSDRLAAFLARGAVVRAVTPAGAGLEARMRDGEASS